jgi:hypothetical protein
LLGLLAVLQAEYMRPKEIFCEKTTNWGYLPVEIGAVGGRADLNRRKGSGGGHIDDVEDKMEEVIN